MSLWKRPFTTKRRLFYGKIFGGRRFADGKLATQLSHKKLVMRLADEKIKRKTPNQINLTLRQTFFSGSGRIRFGSFGFHERGIWGGIAAYADKPFTLRARRKFICRGNAWADDKNFGHSVNRPKRRGDLRWQSRQAFLWQKGLWKFFLSTWKLCETFQMIYGNEYEI